MKKPIFVFILLAAVLPLFSQEAKTKNVSILAGGSFGWYPTFKLGGAEPDKNITDMQLLSNYRWSVQVGLNLWKDLKVLLDFFGDTDAIDNNPMGFLTKLFGQLGYKNALIEYKRHWISGLYRWTDDDGVADTYNSFFYTLVTSLSLQYDISSFFMEDNGGWYVGLVYMSYEGILTATDKKKGEHYPANMMYHGFGLSVGLDTLTGYLLNSFNPFLFWNLESTNSDHFFMPWFKMGWEITVGQMEYANLQGENVSTSWLLGTIDTVVGAAFVYKMSMADITFSVGYNPTFYFGIKPQHNEGLIVRVTLKF